MSTRRLSWIDARPLLEARGLAAYLKPLNSMDYVIHDGPAKLEHLRLDHREHAWEKAHTSDADAKHARIGGFIVDGDLDVGTLVNGEMDFGPSLIVLGSLRATHIGVSGAALLVTGDLIARVYHGYYNHGFLRVLGDMRTDAFVANDYFGEVSGAFSGVFVGSHMKFAQPVQTQSERVLEGLLVPDAFNTKVTDEDEDDQELLDDAKLFDLIESGGPVLRGGPSAPPCTTS